MFLKYLAFLISFSFLLSCGDSQQVSSKGGTETTNGITIVASNGEIAPYATLEIINLSAWKKVFNSNSIPVIDTLIADENGYVVLPELSEARVIIVTYESDDGIEVAQLDESTKTTQLSTALTINGTSLVGDKIIIAGTTFESSINDDGSFSISGVPPGEYDLLLEIDSIMEVGAYIDVKNDTTITIDPLNRSIRFANFYGSNHNSAIEWIGGLISQKVLVSAGSIMLNDEDNLESGHYDIYLDDSLPKNYVGFAMVLSQPDSTNEFNLSGTNTIRLLARGSGEIMCKIWSPLLDSVRNALGSENKYMYLAYFTLTSEWKEHVLTLDDFEIANSDLAESIEIKEAAPLNSVFARVRRMELITSLNNETGMNYEFELKSMYLDGVSQSFW